MERVDEILQHAESFGGGPVEVLPDQSTVDAFGREDDPLDPVAVAWIVGQRGVLHGDPRKGWKRANGHRAPF
jgi:hypothetical protein